MKKVLNEVSKTQKEIKKNILKARKDILSKVSEKDKCTIQKAHAKGLSSEKILTKYNFTYTRQQVAAVKAHATMGTY